MNNNVCQLNPFELKTKLTYLITNFKNVNDLQNYIEDIQLLDAQSDRKTIVKLLYKELYNLKSDDGTIICFLLERYAQKEELTKKLWELLNNDVVANNVKIVAVNFLRGLDSNWELDSGDEVLNAQILDADTKKLLNNAIVNPEVQIDFLDFLMSLSHNDKITLINSLADDYNDDELANILIPVFLSQPDSEVGLHVLELLGKSKSQLAFHTLNTFEDFGNNLKLKNAVKKSLSTLKISGIRNDNSKEFYKDILSDTKFYKCYATYPDGHGNQSLVFSRMTEENRVRFVAIVTDDYHGIRDCFGFFDISQFECDKIVERFFQNDKVIEISPQILKTILYNAELISKNSACNWLVPYEYHCWKNLLNDVDIEKMSYTDILKNNLNIMSLDLSDLEEIFQQEFTSRWFLDCNYSDEFENMLDNVESDLENYVLKNINIVFYQDEKFVWRNRLLACSYLELQVGNKNIAEKLYSLYFDENLLQEFFKIILQKSVYEYFVSLKFDTELNDGKYSIKELDKIISKIEELWVCTK